MGGVCNGPRSDASNCTKCESIRGSIQTMRSFKMAVRLGNFPPGFSLLPMLLASSAKICKSFFFIWLHANVCDYHHTLLASSSALLCNVTSQVNTDAKSGVQEE